ncbi:MAG: YqgE/AlgH family protein [Verrucomicrobiota bacterium]
MPHSVVGGSGKTRYNAGVAADASKPDSPIQLQGYLLLADPSLRDGIFDHSVILLADHSPTEGAFGLILNHPTGRMVGDFVTDKDLGQLRRIPVHEGGPVGREHLTFSVFWWSKKNGLRWAIRISAEDAVKHAHRPGRIVRAFVGHSGWSPGQLEGELRRSSWITTRPAPELLGVEHDRSLWYGILRHLSPFHRVLAEAPAKPLLN